MPEPDEETGERPLVDWDDLVGKLVADADRNRLVVDQVAADVAAGHRALVLSGRIGHLETLCGALQARGVRAELLVGTLGKKLRIARLDALRAGDIDVLGATSVADEGLDLPELTRVVLAYPGRAQGRTVQRLGRIMRRAPGKAQPVLYDVADLRVGLLRAQHLSRMRAIKQALGGG